MTPISTLSTSKEFISLDYSADQIVEEGMTDYILDVAEKKLPHYIDGLKVVARRLMWTFYKLGINSKLDTDDLVTSTNKIHTSGDQSISRACIRLNQPFSIGMNLVRIKGNKGRYSAQAGGADRYTKIFSSAIAKDVFFEKVNMKTIPQRMNEKFTDMEPMYLIPRLPTALLMYTLTIGAGIKNSGLPLGLSNVCDLVKFYIDNEYDKAISRVDYSPVIELFLPNFPINNVILNTTELCEQYRNGNWEASVAVEGMANIYPHEFRINTIPFGIEFSGMIESLIKDIAKNRGVLFGQEVGYKDLSCKDYEADIQFTFKRTADIFSMFEKYKKVLKFNSTTSPLYNFTDEKGTVFRLNPPLIIHKWFTERRKSILAGIKYDQNKTSLDILCNHTRLLLHDHRDDILNIINNRDYNHEQIHEALIDKYKISLPQCKLLTDSSIISLSRVSKESLYKDIDRLRDKAIKLSEDLTRVNEIIYNDAEYFQNTYSKQYPRRTKIDSFLGYVKTKNNGIIQFDTIDSCIETLANFSDSKVYMYREFTEDTKVPYLLIDKKYTGRSPSRIFQGHGILDYYSNMVGLWLGDEETKHSVTTGLLRSIDENRIDKYLPITNEFYGIFGDGAVKLLEVKDLMVASRKKINSDSLMYAIPKFLVDNHKVFFLSANSTENSSIYINKIQKTTKSIQIPVVDNTPIGFILNTGKHYVFNLPEHMSFKYLHIKHPNKLMSQNSMELNFNRSSQRNDIVRSMVEI